MLLGNGHGTGAPIITCSTVDGGQLFVRLGQVTALMAAQPGHSLLWSDVRSVDRLVDEPLQTHGRRPGVLIVVQPTYPSIGQDDASFEDRWQHDESVGDQGTL